MRHKRFSGHRALSTHRVSQLSRISRVEYLESRDLLTVAGDFQRIDGIGGDDMFVRGLAQADAYSTPNWNGDSDGYAFQDDTDETSVQHTLGANASEGVAEAIVNGKISSSANVNINGITETPTLRQEAKISSTAEVNIPPNETQTGAAGASAAASSFGIAKFVYDANTPASSDTYYGVVQIGGGGIGNVIPAPGFGSWSYQATMSILVTKTTPGVGATTLADVTVYVYGQERVEGTVTLGSSIYGFVIGYGELDDESSSGNRSTGFTFKTEINDGDIITYDARLLASYGIDQFQGASIQGSSLHGSHFESGVSFSALVTAYGIALEDDNIPTPGGGLPPFPGDLNNDGQVDEVDEEIFGADGTAIIVVTSEDNSVDSDGDVSLREAIALAADGNHPGRNHIVFAPWVQHIELNGTQLSIGAGNDVSIYGPGAGKLTVDGEDLSRVLVTAAGTDTRIHDLTITRGNVTGNGGGILADGDLTLKRVHVMDNFASNAGGGVMAFGDLTITSSTLNLNQTGSSGSGGAIHFSSDGDNLKITNSTIDDNDAKYGGGLLAAIQSPNAVLIDRSTFSRNSASSIGGGMLIQELGGTATGLIVNSTISGNTSASTGGLRISYGAEFDIVNSTIAFNKGDSGGGLRIQNSTVEMHNSIISENRNTADTAHDDVFGTVNFQTGSSYNLIGRGGAAGLTDNDAYNNIVLVGAETARLKPLDDYGGQTETHALFNDSDALEGGSNSVALGYALGFDQRGGNRVKDGDNDTDPDIDIGAVEMAFSEL